MTEMPTAPKGLHPGEFRGFGGSPDSMLFNSKKAPKFRATGEYRPPKKGEHYLSGAKIFAYQAPNDLGQSFWIAREVEVVKCPHCDGTGEKEAGFKP